MTLSVSSTYGYPSSRKNSLNRVESSWGAWMPARTLPRSAVAPTVSFYRPLSGSTSLGNVAHLRHDSGNGTVRYSILYYEGTKEICAGHQDARGTLFSRGVCMCLRACARTCACALGVNDSIQKIRSIGNSGDGEESYRTESKDAFIWHIGCASDQISRVTVGHLVVTYVVTAHSSALELTKHARDLGRAGSGLQLEREEDLCTLGGIVPVYELRHLARVYDRVKRKKAVLLKQSPMRRVRGTPAGSFWNVHA